MQQVAEGHGTRVTALAIGERDVWSGGGANGLILVHDISTASLIARVYTPHRTENDRVLALVSLGSQVWAGESQGAIVLFDRVAQRVVAEAEERNRGSVYSLAAVDSTCCWAGYADGSLLLWRLVDKMLRVEISVVLSAAVRALALPPNDPLWAALDDSSVLLLDRSSGRRLRSAGEGGGGALLCLTACGGARVCGGSVGGCIRFYDAPSGRLMGEIKGHSGRVTALSPGVQDLTDPQKAGAWSVSVDRTLRHWRSHDSAASAPLEPGAGHLWSVAVSPQALIVGNGEGFVHILPTAPKHPLSSSSSATSLIASNTAAVASTSLPVVAKTTQDREWELERKHELERELEREREQRAKEKEEAERVRERARAKEQECEQQEREQRRESEQLREREREAQAQAQALKERERDREREREAEQQRQRERELEREAEAEKEREEMRRLRVQLRERENELGAAREQCRRLEQALSPPSPPAPAAAAPAPTPSFSSSTTSLLPQQGPSSPAPLQTTKLLDSPVSASLSFVSPQQQQPHAVAPSTPLPSAAGTPIFVAQSTRYSPPSDLSRPSPSSSVPHSPFLASTYDPASPARLLSTRATARQSPSPSASALPLAPSSPNHAALASAPLASAMAALNAERRSLDARLDATCRQASVLRLI